MKILLKILFILLTSLTASPSFAGNNERIPLWGSTYYGMSLKELLLALPAAHSKPENTITLNLKPNEQVLAKKENIEIAGRVFIAWFIFNNDQLNKVALTLLPKEKQIETLSNSEVINAIYTQYAVLLTAKYGEPIKKYWQDYAPLNIRLWQTQWISGMTNVELNVDKASLHIIYGAEYAEDLKKL